MINVFWLTPAIANQETEQTKTDWQDKSHQFIANRADKLAGWIDSFFHNNDYETESAESFMRFRTRHEWYQSKPNDIDISLRGNVHLPALDERLTLIFNDDDTEDKTHQTIDTEQENVNDISLQFNELDKGKYRLDYRIGIRSSGAFKSSIRYRYKNTYSADKSYQIINKLRFRGDEGFENIFRYRHDSVLSDSRILQYRTQINYGEITEGVEWRINPTITKKLPNNRALSYFTDINGITHPHHLTKEYGFGINYRANIGKPYIFWELRPALYFERESIVNKRKANFRLSASIELFFD